MSLRILKSDLHLRLHVDPFGQLPCDHDMMRVYITTGDRLGDDILACDRCGYSLTLRDLYAGIQMPGR